MPPPPANDDEICFFDFAGARAIVKKAQSVGVFGENQNARSALVDSMREFDLRAGADLAQCFDGAEALSDAAVRRHAGRLVDDAVIVVFENDRQPRQSGGGRRRRRLFGRRGRRQAHNVARAQARIGLGALAVDSDLPGADQAIQKIARKARRFAREKIIESFVFVALRDGALDDRRGRRADFSPQTIFCSPPSNRPRAC